MPDDYGHEYEQSMDRDETERLLEHLREHHPEAEIVTGWRSADRPMPKVDRIRDEPERVMAPACTGEVVLTPHTATMSLIREVADKHGVTVADIKGGRRRMRKYVAARHEAMARLRIERGMSMPAIGQLLGGYDHSTVHHGLQRHAARVQREADRGQP